MFKKRIALPILLLAALLALSACTSPAPKQPDGPFALVTDMLSRQVEIAAQPKTIVTLTAANTEIVCALGLQEKLVAVDDYSNYPEGVSALEKIGGFSTPNIEAIVSLSPDIVLAGDKLQQEAIDQLTELGLTVVATEAGSFDHLLPSIKLIGEVLGAKDAASTLCDSLQARIDAVQARAKDIPDAEKPSVYWAVSFGEYGDYTVGRGAFPTDMIAIAGGLSVSRDLEVPWPMYSVEQLTQDDPDFIFIQAGTPGFDAPPYSQLRAATEGRVVEIDPDSSSRPGPRLIDVLEQIQASIYPQA